jgi:hypothetical protein
MSAVMAPAPHDGLRATARDGLPDWISRPQLCEVQVSAALVAVYPGVKPDNNSGAAQPVLHLVLKQPTPAAPFRGGARVHALLWLQPAPSAEQASADAEAAKQRLLAHAHNWHGLVRLQGRSIEARDGGLELWLDGARLLHCVLQPQPQPAPVPRPLMGATL